MLKLSPKLKIGLFLSFSLFFVLSSVFVYAKTLVAPGGVSTLGQFVNGLEKFLFWLAIPLVALAIIIGAVVFLTSFGIPERIALGRKIMTYAGIGLLVVLFGVGLGQWLGEKPVSEVTSFTPVSNEMASATNEYVVFLKNQAADYKSSAQGADATTAAGYKQRAEEMLNIAAPIDLALKDNAKLAQEFLKADNKYQFLDKTSKELPVLKDRWQNSQDKQALNNEIHSDYIVPLVNYGILSANFTNPGASSSWINVLDDADLRTALNTAYQDREKVREKAEINKEYIVNPAGAAVKYGPYPPKELLAVKASGLFFINSAFAADPTPTLIWDGKTAPVLGQTVTAQNVEFFWNGYNWKLKNEADAAKLRPMILVKIKFNDNIEKTYELKETAWMEKATNTLPPNAATWNLLEVSCKSSPRTVNPAKKPCQTCKTYQEAANYFNQVTLGIYHITPYSDFTGMDYNTIGPYEVERLVLFKAYLGEGEKAVQTLLTEIDMLKTGKIFPTADWHFRILGFLPLDKMSTEERAKYDSYTTGGLPHKIWDEYGKALWLENKAWFEQTNVVYDPSTNTEYTQVNDNMWAGNEGQGQQGQGQQGQDQSGGGGQGGQPCSGCKPKSSNSDTQQQKDQPDSGKEVIPKDKAEELQQGKFAPDTSKIAVDQGYIPMTLLMETAVKLERTAYELITNKKANQQKSIPGLEGEDAKAGVFQASMVKDQPEPTKTDAQNRKGAYYDWIGLNPLASLCSGYLCGFGEPGPYNSAPDADDPLYQGGANVKAPSVDKACPCDAQSPCGCCINCQLCINPCPCPCCQPPRPIDLCPCDKSKYLPDDKDLNTLKNDIKTLNDQIETDRQAMEDLKDPNTGYIPSDKKAEYEALQNGDDKQPGIIALEKTLADKNTNLEKTITDKLAKVNPDITDTGSEDYTIDRQEAIRAAKRALKSSNELQNMLNKGRECLDSSQDVWNYADAYNTYCSNEQGAKNFAPFEPQNFINTAFCCPETPAQYKK